MLRESFFAPDYVVKSVLDQLFRIVPRWMFRHGSCRGFLIQLVERAVSKHRVEYFVSPKFLEHENVEETLLYWRQMDTDDLVAKSRVTYEWILDRLTTLNASRKRKSTKNKNNKNRNSNNNNNNNLSSKKKKKTNAANNSRKKQDTK